MIDSDWPITHVARELGMGEQLLSCWAKRERGRLADDPTGALGIDERAELRRLRRETAELRKNNEFPGKAAVFLASKPKRVSVRHEHLRVGNTVMC